MRILICDDEGIVQQAIRFMIQKSFGDEFEIESAKNGRMAIELAKVAAKCAVKLANGEQIVGKDIGENSVKTTDDGKDVPYWGLPPIAVTKENMDSVIIDLGFHLHDEVYLNVSEESRD